MARIKGKDGNDTLTGTRRADEIWGFGGNDTINAKEGDDLVFAGDGNDLVYGDAGNDVLIGGLGRDELFGGDGDDRLQGDRSYRESSNYLYEGEADWLYGGAGSDILHGMMGGDHLWGGSGADRFEFLITAHSTAAAPDTIYDFNPFEGDVIKVPDADQSSANGVQTWKLVTTQTGLTDEATFTTLDLDGDGFADDTRLDLFRAGTFEPEASLLILNFVPETPTSTFGFEYLI